MFATARDATLEVAGVDLSKLTREVVADRTVSADQAPQVYVGQLPVVQVDLRLVRQLMDNLVGNALKYIASYFPP